VPGPYARTRRDAGPRGGAVARAPCPRVPPARARLDARRALAKNRATMPRAPRTRGRAAATAAAPRAGRGQRRAARARPPTALFATALASLAAAALACAGAPPAPSSPADEPALRARIAELVDAIRRDQARLVELLSQPQPSEAPATGPAAWAPLYQREEVREIARRLPAHQRELEALGGREALLRAPSVLR